jgi:REP element-mobilizing transposase RayT
MARPTRLHVAHGLYYIGLKGNGGDAIFRDAEDYEAFSVFAAASLRRNRCHMHAFCWLENSVLMAVEITDVQVGRFVQHLAGQYARYLHGEQKRTGHVFEHHHHALLVQRSHYLLHLVRYIHRAPVRAGLVALPGDYAWSGEGGYLHEERFPWLTTHVTLEMLAHVRTSGSITYRDWTSREDEPEMARQFEHGRKDEPRAIGDDAFMAAVIGKAAPVRPEMMLDEVIACVARHQGVALRSVLSRSRKRQYVLVRALITWKATQNGVATLTEVAARLGRDPSTLWTAMERYRTSRPELFLNWHIGAGCMCHGGPSS